MAITLDESLEDLRTLLYDTAAIRFLDADLLDWLDHGQKDVAALTLCYQRRVVFTSDDIPRVFLPGIREYNVYGAVGSGSLGLGLTDAIRLLHPTLNGESLVRWTPEMLHEASPRADGSGTPKYWYEFARNLGLIPYPSSAFADRSAWTFELLYAAWPADWTSGESVLPAGFDQLPVYFAGVRAFLARRAWADATRLYVSYLQLVNEYRAISLEMAVSTLTQQQTSPRQGEHPERVVRMSQRRRA